MAEFLYILYMFFGAASLRNSNCSNIGHFGKLSIADFSNCHICGFLYDTFGQKYFDKRFLTCESQCAIYYLINVWRFILTVLINSDMYLSL